MTNWLSPVKSPSRCAWTDSQLTTVTIRWGPCIVVRLSRIEAAVPLCSRLILYKAIDTDKEATESIVNLVVRLNLIVVVSFRNAFSHDTPTKLTQVFRK